MNITKNMRKSLHALTRTIRDKGMELLSSLVDAIKATGWNEAMKNATEEQLRQIRRMMHQQGPGRRTAAGMARQIRKKQAAHAARLAKGRWAPTRAIDPAMLPDAIAAFRKRGITRYERYHRSQTKQGKLVMVHNAPRHIREGIGLR